MEQRRKLRIYSNGAFILKITDFDIKAFDLSVKLGISGWILREETNVSDLPKLQLSH